jgi:hypothetical protein
MLVIIVILFVTAEYKTQYLRKDNCTELIRIGDGGRDITGGRKDGRIVKP